MNVKLILPMTVLALVAAFAACRKTEVTSPANPVSVVQPQAISTGGGGLMYFGTPYEMLNSIECTTPCGVCHVVYLPDRYIPHVEDPENNEALMNASVNAQGQLVLAVNLNGVGHFYTDEIEQTRQLPVAMQTEIPQQLVQQACLSSNVPMIPGPVFIPAGVYPVAVAMSPLYTRLDLTGTLAPDGNWSWTAAMY
jgi:hypothetical protein